MPTFINVSGFVLALNAYSRVFSATNQAAQFAFVGSNQFSGSSFTDDTCGFVMSGRYRRIADGLLGDAWDARTHLMADGAPDPAWEVHGGTSCSGYFWGSWGGIQGFNTPVYVDRSELILQSYFEGVQKGILCRSAALNATECRFQVGEPGNELEYAVKSLGGSMIWAGRNRLAGQIADKYYQRGPGDTWRFQGVDLTSGPGTLPRSTGMADTLTTDQVMSYTDADYTVLSPLAYLGDAVALRSIHSVAQPGDLLTLIGRNTAAAQLVEGGNIVYDFARLGRPVIGDGDKAVLQYTETGWEVLALTVAAPRCDLVTATATAYGAGFATVAMPGTTDGTWVVPMGGLYDVRGAIRWADGSPADTAYALGVGPAAIDDTIHNQWCNTSGALRNSGLIGTRMRLAAGDRLRLFTYVDGGATLTSLSASLSALRVAD